MNRPFFISTSDVRGVNLRRPLALLAGVALSFAMATLAYVGLIMLTIPKNSIPSTYKWLLLEHTPGPRIIVDSGSNGHHGIDAGELANAFNMTAINVADNAGYSFVDRSRRILRFARPGDVVIMPIEWQGYFDPDGDAGYARLSLELITEYFWAQTPTERARRILTTPFPIVARAVWRNVRKQLSTPSPIEQTDGVHRAADRLTRAMLYSSGTGDAAPADSSNPAPKVSRDGCSEATLGAPGRELPARLGSAFNNLRQAKARGVRVVLTWPVVVGSDCYRDQDWLHDISGQIRTMASAAGLEIMGDPNDFWMPPEFIKDTHYHVIDEGRAIVTRRLTERLHEAGPSVQSAHLAQPIFNTVSSEIFALELAQTRMVSPPREPLAADEFAPAGSDGRDIDFIAGWWSPESTGRWARNDEAVIRLRPKEPTRAITLRLVSASCERSMTVSINGVEAGRFTIDLSRRDYMVSVPRSVAEASTWTISLASNDAPLAPGASPNDRRILTFLLEGLVLNRSETIP
ncbi:hypothetical protein ACVWW6_006006 [Bradyrhizobium sp. USDA 3311]